MFALHFPNKLLLLKYTHNIHGLALQSDRHGRKAIYFADGISKVTSRSTRFPRGPSTSCL